MSLLDLLLQAAVTSDTLRCSDVLRLTHCGHVINIDNDCQLRNEGGENFHKTDIFADEEAPAGKGRGGELA
ncbi:hypothetical protein ACFOY8_22775 [Thalassospira xianhensis]|uniref:hypothetical protein n=1 Tax=Thalassospira xianhensis TaxID=478503 RepID=UPI0011BEC1B0|nr:hypothetical protein [Thalassospira xianhensis]